MPTRASRQPSCCCRRESRARPSSPSRARPKAPPGSRRHRCSASRRFRSPHTANPHTHFLSNGRYTTAVTHAGGGFSTWRRPGGHAAAGGPDVGRRIAFHLPARSLVRRGVVAHLPSRRPRARRVRGHLRARQSHLRRAATAISRRGCRSPSRPEDDVEVRRLSITNHGDRVREIEVTSYAEIVLGKPEDDLAHPAFGKLFVETEHADQNAGLLFSRRKRSADEESDPRPSTSSVSRAASAARWSGRPTAHSSSAADAPPPIRSPSTDGRSPERPAPCSTRSQRCATACVSCPGRSCASRSRRGSRRIARRALALVSKYRDGSAASRAFSMAFTHAQVTLRHLGLTDDHAMLASRMASRLFGADASVRQPGRPRAESVRPAQPVGLRDLRATCRSCWCA